MISNKMTILLLALVAFLLSAEAQQQNTTINARFLTADGKIDQNNLLNLSRCLLNCLVGESPKQAAALDAGQAPGFNLEEKIREMTVCMSKCLFGSQKPTAASSGRAMPPQSSDQSTPEATTVTTPAPAK